MRFSLGDSWPRSLHRLIFQARPSPLETPPFICWPSPAHWKNPGFLRSGKTWKSQGISKFFKGQGKVREFHNCSKVGENIQKSKFLKVFKSLEIFKIIQKNREIIYELEIYQYCLIFYLNNPPPFFFLSETFSRSSCFFSYSHSLLTP